MKSWNHRMSMWPALALSSASVLLACSGTKTGSVAKDAGVASGTGGSSSSGGSSGDGGSGGAAGTTSVGGNDAGPDCGPLPDLGVRFVGRVDACDPSGVRMEWSGTGFVGKFEGTGVSVHLNDSANQYTVLVDGALMPTLKTVAGDKTYTLASGLADAEHTIELYRRTEASFGTTVVIDVEAEEGDAGTGQLLAPPAAHNRRIEVVGDSISCGYGDEGVNPCSFSADTENDYLAYGSVLARDLDAELSTVAWSGKGIYYNYNGDRVEPMPTLYDRTIPTDKLHLWGFTPQVDLVIINLGTNDYSTSTQPTTDQFVTTYQAFLEHIRGKYPAAYILCTMGPLLSGTALTTVRTNIGTAIAARASAGDTKVKYYEITTANTSPGCDYHPSLATQAAMAAELEVEIKSDLGW